MLAIELALLAIVAVVLFLLAGINVFSLAAMLEQGAPPTVNWGVLIPGRWRPSCPCPGCKAS